jgi:hypothetical protein
MECATLSTTAMNRKAEIVSAFCVLSEILLSQPKIRRFAHLWAPIHAPDVTAPMVLHTPQWREVMVNVKTTGSSDYLGTIVEVKHEGTLLLSTLLDLTHSAIAAINHTTASLITKAAVFKSSVVSSLLYKAQFGNLRMSEYSSTTL